MAELVDWLHHESITRAGTNTASSYVRQDHHLPHGSLEPHITNGDRIRMMTDEELAVFMQNEWLDIAICNELNSAEKWLAWLRKEADSD